MSFLARLFGKLPSRSSAPAAAPVAAAAKTADPARPKPGAAVRAQAAAADEQALQAALHARDMTTLARLVVSGASTRVRQAAAAAIEDPDLLRQLIRDVRGGNDNNVYRVLTGKRDALLEQARQQAQLQAELEDVSAGLERLSQRPLDALSQPKLDALEQRWLAVVEQADPALREQVQPWLNRARDIIAEPQRQAAALAARRQADVEAAAAAAAAAQALREQQAQAAMTAATAADVAADAAATEPSEPEPIAPSEEQLAEQQLLRDIGELMRKARAALNAGNSSRAAAARQAIADKLVGAPPLPAKLLGQMQLLDKQLDELKDWKNFSVTPKRAELIVEMESLIGDSSDPVALADRIKSLKDEWRILGKGAGDQQDAALDADSQRFQDAARQAYEPCRVYFEAQALIHAENQRLREALLVQLTAFEADTDWQRPDWQAVVRMLRDTRLAWRSHVPVDRTASRAQQKQFETVMAGLQGRLDAEFAHNVQQKEALISRAEAWLASDDGLKATDAIKGLQRDWRAIGPVPREVDQRLWERFRQHCDGVFQKREQASAAFAAELEQNKRQAIALCEQIEQIATLEGAELVATAATRAELRTAFEALGKFPRADAGELRKRFEHGLERCDKALARQKTRAAEQAWQDLFDAANHLRAYRLAVARNADAEQIAILKAAFDDRLASIPQWPRHGLEALRQAQAAAPATDLAANEAALKLLCIRAEIQTETPTPPEDQALRRDYQLQRLVQGLREGVRADASHLDQLAIEWVAANPVDDDTYAPLLQRFRRCREQAMR